MNARELAEDLADGGPVRIRCRQWLVPCPGTTTHPVAVGRRREQGPVMQVLRWLRERRHPRRAGSPGHRCWGNRN
jgi:hypothetical protein